MREYENDFQDFDYENENYQEYDDYDVNNGYYNAFYSDKESSCPDGVSCFECPKAGDCY